MLSFYSNCVPNYIIKYVKIRNSSEIYFQCNQQNVCACGGVHDITRIWDQSATGDQKVYFFFFKRTYNLFTIAIDMEGIVLICNIDLYHE